MTNTYTLAQRHVLADTFRPIEGIPLNMSKAQAEANALTARANGFDVVAYNWKAE